MYPNPKLAEVLAIIILLVMPLFAAILIALRRYKTWKILLTLMLCTWFSSLATLVTVNPPENGLAFFANLLLGWIFAAPVIPFLLLLLCIRAIATRLFPRTVPILKNAARISLRVLILGCILAIGYGFLPPGEQYLKDQARWHAYDLGDQNAYSPEIQIILTSTHKGWHAKLNHPDPEKTYSIDMNLYGAFDYSENNSN